MLTPNEFLDLVRRSSLVEEDQLTKFLGGLSAQSGCDSVEGADKLATELVAAGMLTEWQANKLLSGKFKGVMLDEFKLLGHVARRDTCQVYSALDTLEDRLVKLWVVPQQKWADLEFINQFHADVKSTAKSRGINQLREIRDANIRYFVMECAESC